MSAGSNLSDSSSSSRESTGEPLWRSGGALEKVGRRYIPYIMYMMYILGVWGKIFYIY